MELSHALAVSVLLALFIAYLSWKRIIAHLFDWIGTRYTRRMAGRKKRLFEGLEQARERRGDGRLVILDLGCGPGTNFRFFPPGSDVICVDPNRHFDPIVRRNVREFPDVRVSRFLVGVAENLRDLVEADSVDAVVVTKVLCSVTDVARSLREIIRVLKPVSSYTVSQKRHLTLAHNFTKYWPIFKLLSLLDSVGTLQQSHIQIPHHTLNVSLHYLVKYLCSKKSLFLRSK